jgi:spore coat polysaccharide biosynthesis protein SpsF
MSSTGLPWEALTGPVDKSLTVHTLERVTRCHIPDEIVLVVPASADSGQLESLAVEHGVTLFQGCGNDLVDHCYQAAKKCSADIVGYLPTDSCVSEPEEIDRILTYHGQGKCHFSSNLAQVYDNGYPTGIGAEVYDFAALEYVWEYNRDSIQRQYVHLNFFNYKKQQPVDPERFTVGTVICPTAFRHPNLILSATIWAQYEFIQSLYAELYSQNPQFHVTDVIAWLDRTRPSAQPVRDTNGKHIYCIDIDGTICDNTDGAYEDAKPYDDVIDQIRQLYNAGHTIFFQTARGATTGINWRELTEAQLKGWGLNHHGLFVGCKPTADIYIDDKGINAIAWRTSGFSLNLTQSKQQRVGDE